ncbi:MAG: WecB/TagA/CpsF family glycosyltransferase [Paludibacteraceae bacterium]|nr:WecB/TagA/CpsF family glycosyltransferase [Paludibacteraceae bacterium]
MFSLYNLNILSDKQALSGLPEGKLLINTINAHSYNVAQEDALFAEALQNGDVLTPDGASIVHACRYLHTPSQPRERVAGWDVFIYEMTALEKRAEATNTHPVVFFMGSSPDVLQRITERAALDFPYLKIVTYSPPYKPEFTTDEDAAIVRAINSAHPDLLWIGMTAPKQEKWTYTHWQQLDIHCHVGTIGAVFDFYAGTAKRAPLWWQRHSLEWLYRLIKEPRRMWRRYIIGNALFIRNVLREKSENGCRNTNAG